MSEELAGATTSVTPAQSKSEFIVEPLPCPFKYKSGKQCTGHISRVEAFKADLSWTLENGTWKFRWGEPRSHFHLYCSEKGSHAGFGREDNSQLKTFDLPKQIAALSPE